MEENKSAHQNSNNLPSIFNDVIGPVMRGPSASHCAAAVRIGRLARDLMDGKIDEVLIEFDPEGSLATTHESQGSDIGLCAGLLGWDATDERLPVSARAIEEAGIRISINIIPFDAHHPNIYRLTLKNEIEQHSIVALSTGGGMIEIIELDTVRLSMMGDYFETLLYFRKTDEDKVIEYLNKNCECDMVLIFKNDQSRFIEVKSQRFLPPEVLAALKTKFNIRSIKELEPILPVLSRAKMMVPFITSQEMFEFNKGHDFALWELALQYESARGNLSTDKVFKMMSDIVVVLKKSIQSGIEGTDYQDRILGYQSGLFKSKMDEDVLLDGGILNRMTLYVTALMEMKSAMGIVVAAPTAGSCGGLPGACIAAGHAMGCSRDEMTKAMLAAGMIGIFIAAHSTFAAEVCGCQAECGAGSGMAAAALVTLAGGTLNQSIAAASMALQNTLGMICDPVANRVEVPCLGKNVLAASNALACANMALADYDPVIPLDEVIETMDKVGKSIPRELCCTALGGLSITETSKNIETRLRSTKRARTSR